MQRGQRIALIAAAGVGTLLLVVLVLLLNLQWFRGPIERAVTSATGRETQLRGELRLWPLLPPRLVVGEFRFANASWGREPQMITARRVVVRPLFWRLVRGQLAFRSIEADGLRVLLEANEEGTGNWVLHPDQKRDGKTDTDLPAIEIRRLALTDSSLEMHDPKIGTDVVVKADARPAKGDQGTELRLDGKGEFHKQDFRLEARFGLPREIDADDGSVDARIKASAGTSTLEATGRLPASIVTTGAQMHVKLGGDNMGDIGQLVKGIALPETAPYALEGDLAWTPKQVRFTRFKGHVGDSELQGDATVRLGGPRFKITARLVSPRLDLDDLGTLIGIPPSTAEGETVSRAQREKKARLEAKGRVLPDTPLEVSRLRIVDADVDWEAKHITSRRLPLRTMRTHVTLDDGLLKVWPFDFDAASGKVSSRVTLDARAQPMKFDFSLDMRGLKLAEIAPKLEAMKDAVGQMGGGGQLRGQGTSLADMLAHADGELKVILGPGQVSNLVLEAAGLDVAEALKFLVAGDKKVPLRCAYADFGVERGVASARALAFDTEDTAIVGKGGVDLRQEKLDLTFYARPKDVSPISLRSPLHIGGTFIDPSFRPEGKSLALRAAAVAALWAIAPPAALLGLIETGPGKDVRCGPGSKADTKENPESALEKAGDAGPHPVAR